MFFKRFFKCRHKVARYYSQPVYGEPRFVTTDGMGVKHYEVWARCDKCDENFHVVNIHLPK